MIQGNYKQNDENELLLVSEAEDVVLFRHERDEVMYAYDLEEYLNNHPDIKGIEYQGKIMNADELEESWSAGFEAVYADEEGETESAS